MTSPGRADVRVTWLQTDHTKEITDSKMTEHTVNIFMKKNQERTITVIIIGQPYLDKYLQEPQTANVFQRFYRTIVEE